MATTLDSRPSATTLDVEALVSMAWAGKIRVPHFQRDFRWGWEDVRRLFDSIVKGYPVGSLLLWIRKAPAQTLRLGALEIDAPEADDSWWVVDGQQRLTSLANALHVKGQSEPRFALAYDLTERQFVRTPPVENPLVIPLPVIFDLQLLLRWFADHPGISDQLDQASAVTRSIRQFEIPAYQVTQDDTSVLQDIFDRMNNYGKRLSRAEIFSALNAGDESDLEGSLTFEKIAARIDVDYGFGTLDNETVLAAVLARRGSEVRRDIRSEFASPKDEGRDAAYEAGEKALRRAVEFLQREAGVPHVSMLAYRYLIVVLARVFAFFPEPDVRSLQLLRRWYWRAAVVGPEQFKGSTPNAARVLCAKVTQNSLDLSVQGLLGAISRRDVPLPDLSRFSTFEAATKIVLCGWWARKPRNPTTGALYEQEDLAESLTDQKTARDAVRYLMPRRSIPEDFRPWAANRALMPTLDLDTREINSYISRQPLDMASDEWLAMLDSHLITVDMSEMLAAGQSVQFLEARDGLLKSSLNRFIARLCEWEFEDTPSISSLILEDDPDDAS